MVIKLHSLHDHLYFVIAVLSAADNIQSQIDLGICVQM